MSGRNGTLFIGILATVICLYDLYTAIFGSGVKIVAWVLAVIMAAIAFSSFRRLSTLK
jgi:hypothetical protein